MVVNGTSESFEGDTTKETVVCCSLPLITPTDTPSDLFIEAPIAATVQNGLIHEYKKVNYPFQSVVKVVIFG